MEDNNKISVISDSKEVKSRKSLTIEDNSEANYKNKELWGTRHTMAFMSFLGLTLVYAMRVNLSVSIVAMVKHKATKPSDGNSTTVAPDDQLACPLPDGYADDSDEESGEFEWDEKTQGWILGAFYYGYTCTNLLGGLAAERYGGKVVVGGGILLTAVFTMLSPMAARVSSGLFFALRFLEGVGEGVTYPAINTLIAAWVLPPEFSKYSSFIYSGSQMGTVVTLSVSGFLCDSNFLGGWPSAFYVFGFLGLVWSAAWFVLVRDSPAQHPRISQQEKIKLAPLMTGLKKSNAKKIPWMKFMTSVPMWGVLVAQVGYNWGFYTLLTELPTYLDQIQHFSLSSNGLLSALPYLIMYIFSLFWGTLMDRMTRAGTISVVNVRRLAVGVSSYLPMLALIGMCFVECDRVLAMVVICISVGTCGTMFCGYLCSHVELAPRYAGTLMGITNTFATIPGFLSPIITGILTKGNQTLPAWHTVFLISSVVYGLGATVYIFTIQAHVQPWNFYGLEDEADDPEEMMPPSAVQGIDGPEQDLSHEGKTNSAS